MDKPRSEKNNSRNPIKWINKNTSKAQAYTNIISTCMTFFALIITIYYSNKNIKESQVSNKNATDQLILAKQQFELSKIEIAKNRIKEVKQDREQVQNQKEQKLQKYYDSLRLAKNDLFQVESFNQQKLINEQQLKAITKQANTAEAQFNLQSIQDADLYERNKAIFNPDTVIINKFSLANSYVSFKIMNTGNSWGHIDSTYVAVYNPKYLYFNDLLTITNVDLVNLATYTTHGLAVFSSYIDLDNTYYCLLVYYYDTADRKQKAIPKFFRYTYNSKKDFVLLPLDPPIRNAFYNEMLKRPHFKNVKI